MSQIINLGQNNRDSTTRTESICTSIQNKFIKFSADLLFGPPASITRLVELMLKITHSVDDHFYREKIRNEKTPSSASILLHSPSESYSVYFSSRQNKRETITNQNEALTAGGMQIENSVSSRSSSSENSDNSLMDGLFPGTSPEIPIYLFSQKNNFY